MISLAKPDITIVVLAAGEAFRMGMVKQLLPVFSIPLIDFQIRRWQSVVENEIIVVTGAYNEQVRSTSKLENVKWTFNQRWENGLGSSIAHGIETCNQFFPEAKACLLILLDQVCIGPSHLMKLIDAWEREPEHIIASSIGQKAAPPIIFPAQYWNELLFIDHKKGAASFLKQYPMHITKVNLPEAEKDLDTPEDYELFLKELKDPSSSTSNT
jgi:molybdenum cofactor cytidylyltransferase